MTRQECGAPLATATLVDYLQGELTGAEEARVEEHYFGCGTCTRRLEAVRSLGAGIADLVRRGRVSVSVTGEALERAAADGVSMREYALDPGGSVDCTAGPDDDFVVVRLAGPFAQADELTLEVETQDLSGGTLGGTRRLEVAADRSREEVILLFSGEVVRSYPRSRWTMNVASSSPESPLRAGPYVMNHTPWEELV